MHVFIIHHFFSGTVNRYNKLIPFAKATLKYAVNNFKFNKINVLYNNIFLSYQLLRIFFVFFITE